MRLSNLFSTTMKNVSGDEISRNAQLLTRAGYIDKLSAGIYSFLPLGIKVLNRIENIIREEMDYIGGQEILMPALHPKDIWDKTGRWETVDVLFKMKGKGNKDLALGPTHEEVVTPLVSKFAKSYKDLPIKTYQIQTKFREEQRAKSGLLRGREFRMKDMYSFHTSQDDLDKFYEDVIIAYNNIYKRVGLGDLTLLTFASGGSFSKYSHEFQTITEYGEDTIFRIPNTNIAINKEIINDTEALLDIIPTYKSVDEKNFEELKAIEVGNIFKLGTRFSSSFNAKFSDSDGKENDIIMGCYGLGPSRIMGTIVECLSDERGIIWPEEIAPYQIHLACLGHDQECINQSELLYEKLISLNYEVLFDDRDNIRPGEKLADADLIGIPNRIIISPKTLSNDCIEYKKRSSTENIMISICEIEEYIKNLRV